MAARQCMKLIVTVNIVDTCLGQLFCQHIQRLCQRLAR